MLENAVVFRMGFEELLDGVRHIARTIGAPVAHPKSARPFITFEPPRFAWSTSDVESL